MVDGQAGKGSKYRPTFISEQERTLRHILGFNSKISAPIRKKIIKAIDSKDINIMGKILTLIDEV